MVLFRVYTFASCNTLCRHGQTVAWRSPEEDWKEARTRQQRPSLNRAAQLGVEILSLREQLHPLQNSLVGTNSQNPQAERANGPPKRLQHGATETRLPIYDPWGGGFGAGVRALYITGHDIYTPVRTRTCEMRAMSSAKNDFVQKHRSLRCSLVPRCTCSAPPMDGGKRQELVPHTRSRNHGAFSHQQQGSYSAVSPLPL